MRNEELKKGIDSVLNEIEDVIAETKMYHHKVSLALHSLKFVLLDIKQHFGELDETKTE